MTQKLHFNRKAILADIAACDKRIAALEKVGYTESARGVRSDRAHLLLLLEILNKQETDNGCDKEGCKPNNNHASNRE